MVGLNFFIFPEGLSPPEYAPGAQPCFHCISTYRSLYFVCRLIVNKNNNLYLGGRNKTKYVSGSDHKENASSKWLEIREDLLRHFKSIFIHQGKHQL